MELREGFPSLKGHHYAEHSSSRLFWLLEPLLKPSGLRIAVFVLVTDWSTAPLFNLHLVPGWFLAYGSFCKHLPRCHGSVKVPLEVPIVFAWCYLQLPSIGFPLRKSSIFFFFHIPCSYSAVHLCFITFLPQEMKPFCPLPPHSMLSGHCTCKLGSLWPPPEPAPPHDALKTDTKEVIVEPLLIKLAQWTNIRINDSPVHLEECFTYFKVEQSSFKSYLFNSVHFCKNQASLCLCVCVCAHRE